MATPQEESRLRLDADPRILGGALELVSAVGGNGADELELEMRFKTLSMDWKANRDHSSSIVKLYAHPAYQQIVEMGEKAIPLLLRELDREPDHWFSALKLITGVNPVPQESRANITEMARSWIKWGRDQGYRW